MPSFERQVLGDGSVRLADAEGAFVIRRPRPGLLHVEITGWDHGQFGTAALDEFDRELDRAPTLELFVDTRGTINASPHVSDTWAEWLRARKPRLKRVNVLVASPYVQLTIEVAKLFSRTGELMRIYTDAAAFSAALATR